MSLEKKYLMGSNSNIVSKELCKGIVGRSRLRNQYEKPDMMNLERNSINVETFV